MGERRPNGGFLPIGKKFNRGKFHMPRDGHKESQLVNIHDVDAESHVAIQQKDVRGNRRHSVRNMWLPPVDCLPFQRGDIRPKMSSAARISKRVIGQFGIRFKSMNERKYRVEG
jgi:hypothetical protein